MDDSLENAHQDVRGKGTFVSLVQKYHLNNNNNNNKVEKFVFIRVARTKLGRGEITYLSLSPHL